MILIDDSDQHFPRREADDKRREMIRREKGLGAKLSKPRGSSGGEGPSDMFSGVYFADPAMRTIVENLSRYM